MDYLVKLLFISGRFLTQVAGRTILQVYYKTVDVQQNLVLRYYRATQLVGGNENMLDLLNSRIEEIGIHEGKLSACFTDEIYTEMENCKLQLPSATSHNQNEAQAQTLINIDLSKYLNKEEDANNKDYKATDIAVKYSSSPSIPKDNKACKKISTSNVGDAKKIKRKHSSQSQIPTPSSLLINNKEEQSEDFEICQIIIDDKTATAKEQLLIGEQAKKVNSVNAEELFSVIQKRLKIELEKRGFQDVDIPIKNAFTSSQEKLGIKIKTDSKNTSKETNGQINNTVAEKVEDLNIQSQDIASTSCYHGKSQDKLATQEMLKNNEKNVKQSEEALQEVQEACLVPTNLLSIELEDFNNNNVDTQKEVLFKSDLNESNKANKINLCAKCEDKDVVKQQMIEDEKVANKSALYDWEIESQLMLLEHEMGLNSSYNQSSSSFFQNTKEMLLNEINNAALTPKKTYEEINEISEENINSNNNTNNSKLTVLTSAVIIEEISRALNKPQLKINNNEKKNEDNVNVKNKGRKSKDKELLLELNDNVYMDLTQCNVKEEKRETRICGCSGKKEEKAKNKTNEEVEDYLIRKVREKVNANYRKLEANNKYQCSSKKKDVNYAKKKVKSNEEISTLDCLKIDVDLNTSAQEINNNKSIKKAASNNCAFKETMKRLKEVKLAIEAMDEEEKPQDLHKHKNQNQRDKDEDDKIKLNFKEIKRELKNINYYEGTTKQELNRNEEINKKQIKPNENEFAKLQNVKELKNKNKFADLKYSEKRTIKKAEDEDKNDHEFNRKDYEISTASKDKKSDKRRSNLKLKKEANAEDKHKKLHFEKEEKYANKYDDLIHDKSKETFERKQSKNCVDDKISWLEMVKYEEKLSKEDEAKKSKREAVGGKFVGQSKNYDLHPNMDVKISWLEMVKYEEKLAKEDEAKKSKREAVGGKFVGQSKNYDLHPNMDDKISCLEMVKNEEKLAKEDEEKKSKREAVGGKIVGQSKCCDLHPNVDDKINWLEMVKYEEKLVKKDEEKKSKKVAVAGKFVGQSKNYDLHPNVDDKINCLEMIKNEEKLAKEDKEKKSKREAVGGKFAKQSKNCDLIPNVNDKISWLEMVKHKEKLVKKDEEKKSKKEAVRGKFIKQSKSKNCDLLPKVDDKITWIEMVKYEEKLVKEAEEKNSKKEAVGGKFEVFLPMDLEQEIDGFLCNNIANDSPTSAENLACLCGKKRSKSDFQNQPILLKQTSRLLHKEVSISPSSFNDAAFSRPQKQEDIKLTDHYEINKCDKKNVCCRVEEKNATSGAMSEICFHEFVEKSTLGKPIGFSHANAPFYDLEFHGNDDLLEFNKSAKNKKINEEAKLVGAKQMASAIRINKERSKVRKEIFEGPLEEPLRRIKSKKDIIKDLGITTTTTISDDKFVFYSSEELHAKEALKCFKNKFIVDLNNSVDYGNDKYSLSGDETWEVEKSREEQIKALFEDEEYDEADDESFEHEDEFFLNSMQRKYKDDAFMKQINEKQAEYNKDKEEMIQREAKEYRNNQKQLSLINKTDLEEEDDEFQLYKGEENEEDEKKVKLESKEIQKGKVEEKEEQYMAEKLKERFNNTNREDVSKKNILNEEDPIGLQVQAKLMDKKEEDYFVKKAKERLQNFEVQAKDYFVKTAKESLENSELSEVKKKEQDEDYFVKKAKESLQNSEPQVEIKEKDEDYFVKRAKESLRDLELHLKEKEQDEDYFVKKAQESIQNSQLVLKEKEQDEDYFVKKAKESLQNSVQLQVEKNQQDEDYFVKRAKESLQDLKLHLKEKEQDEDYFVKKAKESLQNSVQLQVEKKQQDEDYFVKRAKESLQDLKLHLKEKEQNEDYFVQKAKESLQNSVQLQLEKTQQDEDYFVKRAKESLQDLKLHLKEKEQDEDYFVKKAKESLQNSVQLQVEEKQQDEDYFVKRAKESLQDLKLHFKEKEQDEDYFVQKAKESLQNSVQLQLEKTQQDEDYFVKRAKESLQDLKLHLKEKEQDEDYFVKKAKESLQNSVQLQVEKKQQDEDYFVKRAKESLQDLKLHLKEKEQDEDYFVKKAKESLQNLDLQVNKKEQEDEDYFVKKAKDSLQNLELQAKGQNEDYFVKKAKENLQNSELRVKEKETEQEFKIDDYFVKKAKDKLEMLELQESAKDEDYFVQKAKTKLENLENMGNNEDYFVEKASKNQEQEQDQKMDDYFVSKAKEKLLNFKSLKTEDVAKKNDEEMLDYAVAKAREKMLKLYHKIEDKENKEDEDENMLFALNQKEREELLKQDDVDEELSANATNKMLMMDEVFYDSMIEGNLEEEARKRKENTKIEEKKKIVDVYEIEDRRYEIERNDQEFIHFDNANANALDLTAQRQEPKIEKAKTLKKSLLKGDGDKGTFKKIRYEVEDKVHEIKHDKEATNWFGWTNAGAQEGKEDSIEYDKKKKTLSALSNFREEKQRQIREKEDKKINEYMEKALNLNDDVDPNKDVKTTDVKLVKGKRELELIMKDRIRHNFSDVDTKKQALKHKERKQKIKNKKSSGIIDTNNLKRELHQATKPEIKIKEQKENKHEDYAVRRAREKLLSSSLNHPEENVILINDDKSVKDDKDILHKAFIAKEEVVENEKQQVEYTDYLTYNDLLKNEDSGVEDSVFCSCSHHDEYSGKLMIDQNVNLTCVEEELPITYEFKTPFIDEAKQENIKNERDVKLSDSERKLFENTINVRSDLNKNNNNINKADKDKLKQVKTKLSPEDHLKLMCSEIADSINDVYDLRLKPKCSSSSPPSSPSGGKPQVFDKYVSENNHISVNDSTQFFTNFLYDQIVLVDRKERYYNEEKQKIFLKEQGKSDEEIDEILKHAKESDLCPAAAKKCKEDEEKDKATNLIHAAATVEDIRKKDGGGGAIKREKGDMEAMKSVVVEESPRIKRENAMAKRKGTEEKMVVDLRGDDDHDCEDFSYLSEHRRRKNVDVENDESSGVNGLNLPEGTSLVEQVVKVLFNKSLDKSVLEEIKSSAKKQINSERESNKGIKEINSRQQQQQQQQQAQMMVNVKNEDQQFCSSPLISSSFSDSNLSPMDDIFNTTASFVSDLTNALQKTCESSVKNVKDNKDNGNLNLMDMFMNTVHSYCVPKETQNSLPEFTRCGFGPNLFELVGKSFKQVSNDLSTACPKIKETKEGDEEHQQVVLQTEKFLSAINQTIINMPKSNLEETKENLLIKAKQFIQELEENNEIKKINIINSARGFIESLSQSFLLNQNKQKSANHENDFAASFHNELDIDLQMMCDCCSCCCNVASCKDKRNVEERVTLNNIFADSKDDISCAGSSEEIPTNKKTNLLKPPSIIFDANPKLSRTYSTMDGFYKDLKISPDLERLRSNLFTLKSLLGSDEKKLADEPSSDLLSNVSYKTNVSSAYNNQNSQCSHQTRGNMMNTRQRVLKDLEDTVKIIREQLSRQEVTTEFIDALNLTSLMENQSYANEKIIQEFDKNIQHVIEALSNINKLSKLKEEVATNFLVKEENSSNIGKTKEKEDEAGMLNEALTQIESGLNLSGLSESLLKEIKTQCEIIEANEKAFRKLEASLLLRNGKENVEKIIAAEKEDYVLMSDAGNYDERSQEVKKEVEEREKLIEINDVAFKDMEKIIKDTHKIINHDNNINTVLKADETRNDGGKPGKTAAPPINVFVNVKLPFKSFPQRTTSVRNKPKNFRKSLSDYFKANASKLDETMEKHRKAKNERMTKITMPSSASLKKNSNRMLNNYASKLMQKRELKRELREVRSEEDEKEISKVNEKQDLNSSIKEASEKGNAELTAVDAKIINENKETENAEDKKTTSLDSTKSVAKNLLQAEIKTEETPQKFIDEEKSELNAAFSQEEKIECKVENLVKELKQTTSEIEMPNIHEDGKNEPSTRDLLKNKNDKDKDKEAAAMDDKATTTANFTAANEELKQALDNQLNKEELPNVTNTKNKQLIKKDASCNSYDLNKNKTSLLNFKKCDKKTETAISTSKNSSGIYKRTAPAFNGLQTNLTKSGSGFLKVKSKGSLSNKIEEKSTMTENKTLKNKKSSTVKMSNKDVSIEVSQLDAICSNVASLKMLNKEPNDKQNKAKKGDDASENIIDQLLAGKSLVKNKALQLQNSKNKCSALIKKPNASSASLIISSNNKQLAAVKEQTNKHKITTKSCVNVNNQNAEENKKGDKKEEKAIIKVTNKVQLLKINSVANEQKLTTNASQIKNEITSSKARKSKNHLLKWEDMSAVQLQKQKEKNVFANVTDAKKEDCFKGLVDELNKDNVKDKEKEKCKENAIEDFLDTIAMDQSKETHLLEKIELDLEVKKKSSRFSASSTPDLSKTRPMLSSGGSGKVFTVSGSSQWNNARIKHNSQRKMNELEYINMEQRKKLEKARALQMTAQRNYMMSENKDRLARSTPNLIDQFLPTVHEEENGNNQQQKKLKSRIPTLKKTTLSPILPQANEDNREDEKDLIIVQENEKEIEANEEKTCKSEINEEEALSLNLNLEREENHELEQPEEVIKEEGSNIEPKENILKANSEILTQQLQNNKPDFYSLSHNSLIKPFKKFNLKPLVVINKAEEYKPVRVYRDPYGTNVHNLRAPLLLKSIGIAASSNNKNGVLPPSTTIWNSTPRIQIAAAINDKKKSDESKEMKKKEKKPKKYKYETKMVKSSVGGGKPMKVVFLVEDEQE